jgi:hypothetical protein
MAPLLPGSKDDADTDSTSDYDEYDTDTESCSQFQHIEIPKLDGAEGYRTWAALMEAILEREQTWDVVSNDTFKLAKEADRGYSKLQSLNRRGRGTILLNVSDEILKDICEIQNANEVWEFLKIRYTVAPHTRSFEGSQNLKHLRFDECSDIFDYLAKANTCIRDIQSNAMGEEVPEWFLVQLVLGNLGPKWDGWMGEFMGGVRRGEQNDHSMYSINRITAELLDEARWKGITCAANSMAKPDEVVKQADTDQTSGSPAAPICTPTTTTSTTVSPLALPTPTPKATTTAATNPTLP